MKNWHALAVMTAFLLAACGQAGSPGPGNEPGGPEDGALATVLGEDLSGSDPDEAQGRILTALLDRYAEEQGIRVADAEIDAYLQDMEETLAESRKRQQARLEELQQVLASDGASVTKNREALERERDMLSGLLGSGDAEEDLTPEEQAELAAMRRDMARAMIRHWKINRALYRQYGGRVIYQQAGPEPLDAYRQYLEEQQAAGAFVIRDPELASRFWRYFRDESIHSFMEDEAAAEVFARPPWE